MPTSDRRADLGIYHNQIFTKMTKLFSLAQETIVSGYDQKLLQSSQKVIFLKRLYKIHRTS